jgi:hypothetical protein
MLALLEPVDTLVGNAAQFTIAVFARLDAANEPTIPATQPFVLLSFVSSLP